MAIASQAPSSFQVCGRSFLAFVLKPEPPIGGWLEEVDSWLARSPAFFSEKPVVIDVAGLQLTKPSMSELIFALKARGIRVMGMMGVELGLADPDLPPVLSLATASTETKKAQKPQAQAAKAQHSPLLVDSPSARASRCFTTAMSLSSVRSLPGRRSSRRAQSTSTERCAAGCWPALTGTQTPIFSAGAPRPNSSQSTDITAWPTRWPPAWKAIHAWLENEALTIKALD